VTGTRGAPGASTLSVALACAASDGERPVLVDADPDGGTFAALFGRSAHPGLVELAASARHGADALDLAGCVQECSPRFDLLAAPANPDQVSAALGRLGGAWSIALDSRSTVADLGRWRPGSPALDLVEAAVAVVLVVEPTVAGVAHATATFDDLSSRCPNVIVAVRGVRPYPPAEVAAALGAEEVVELRTDRFSVGSLAAVATGRWPRRSVLARDAREIHDRIAVAAGRVAT
jgi:MinD-like ATPase involved in chromosome partitioning or flagellar assembly